MIAFSWSKNCCAVDSELGEGISAACGWQWPTGTDHGLVAVSFPAIQHGADAARDVPLASRLIPVTSRARVGVESIPAFRFVWWKAYAQCPWITWASTEVAMITDSRAVAVKSLNLVIVGWLREVHSSESSLVEAPRRHFSKANGPTGSVVESSYSGAGDDLSAVAPFASQAAITIEHTYVGALSPHPKLLRGSDRE